MCNPLIWFDVKAMRREQMILIPKREDPARARIRGDEN